MMSDSEDYFKKETGESLEEMYQRYHPQVLSSFEDELEKYWGRKWKANSEIGRLRMVLLHRPGREFLSVGKPTPWAPHSSSLGAWRMSWKPENLDELTRDFENLKKGYEDEGVEVVERKPDPNDPPYQVKAIYTNDVSYPAVYGQILLRMYDDIRKGEELPTYQTFAEIGCPVVGMILGRGMSEGGPIKWLDEKHVIVAVHHARSNTNNPEVWRANEYGHEQFARIVKLQDPEVDVRVFPGYGYKARVGHVVDRHTSVYDPKNVEPRLLEWVKGEMNWNFIVPPDEVCRVRRGRRYGPDTGVTLAPGKIIVPTGNPEGRKWLESVGIEVVEVNIASLVRPKNSGSINCTHGAIIRDPEPSD